MADLSSTPGPLGFPPRLSARLSLTYRRRCSRIDQELFTTRFSFRYRVQPLCRVGWQSFTLVGLYQHPFDGSVVVFAAGVIGVSRDAVSFPLLALSFHQQSFIACPPGLEDKTVSRKVCRLGIGLAFAFAFLVFIFIFLIFAVFAFLVFAFALLVAFCLSCLCLCPTSRDPWVQHHQRPYPLVLGNSQTASS